MAVWDYFTDPILRAPTIGCMLMAMAASLVGVMVYVRRRSLLGEALSHASYPGVVLAIIIFSLLFPNAEHEDSLAIAILSGAFASSLIGLGVIDLLNKAFKIDNDAALCFVLSAFFGIGITMASRVQITHPQEYLQIQSYLYGQAATMTDVHILIYAILVLCVASILFFFFKELQAIAFDYDYARSIGLPTQLIEGITYFLIVLAVVVGIRSVGVVLMSAMLIAPAVAARQFTHKLSTMLILASIFGLISGFLGNYLSLEFSDRISQAYSSSFSLPTGPMIVVSAAAISLFALLFAPERGMLVRFYRICSFRLRCNQENMLKAIWRYGGNEGLSWNQLTFFQRSAPLASWWSLNCLSRQGWIHLKDGAYQLTSDGRLRAAHIVRLHRLWEVYLVDYLGASADRVHLNAEEMEHIITPELEKELTKLLHNPALDPHHQPIPPVDNSSEYSL